MRWDSARSTTAAESRFRLHSPNAEPRRMLVTALDPGSAKTTAGLASQDWHGLSFAGIENAGQSIAAGQWPRIMKDAQADVVIMVASPGYPLDAAREIGNYGIQHGIKVSAVVLTAGVGGKAVSEALQALRPWTCTLTILEDPSYLSGLLHALGS